MRRVPLGVQELFILQESTPGFQWVSYYPTFNFIWMFCRSLFVLLCFFLLAIVLSVRLRYTGSDYPIGIFKLFCESFTISTTSLLTAILVSQMTTYIFRLSFRNTRVRPRLFFYSKWGSCCQIISRLQLCCSDVSYNFCVKTTFDSSQLPILLQWIHSVINLI